MHEELFSLRWLIGDSVASVGFDADADSWSVRFASGSGVYIPCLWRVLRDGALACTSADHGHQFGLPAPFDALGGLAQLEGRTVQAVSVRAGTGDLALRFDEKLDLEVIRTSTGYEGWNAVHPTLGNVFTTGDGALNAMS